MQQHIQSLLSCTPSSLSEEEVSQVLDLLPTLEQWIKDFKEQVISNIQETGVLVPGYTLKEYRKRTIPDKEQALETIRTYDPDLYAECVRPQSLRTLAELQKILGTCLFEKLLTPHITIETSQRLVKEKA